MILLNKPYSVYCVLIKSLESLLLTNDYSVMWQLGTSAFNTVVRWHKLGEVENKYTAEKLVLFAVFMPNIFAIGGTLTKFWQKISSPSFVRHGVHTLVP